MKKNKYLKTCPVCGKSGLTYNVYMNHLFRHENARMKKIKNNLNNDKTNN